MKHSHPPQILDLPWQGPSFTLPFKPDLLSPYSEARYEWSLKEGCYLLKSIYVPTAAASSEDTPDAP